MQTGSSSSHPPKKPRQGVQPPPKETKKTNDRKRCCTTFSKRHKSILKKAVELNTLTSAHLAVIMLSPGGKLHSFGKPSVEEVYSQYLLGCNSRMTLPMSPKEVVDRAEKECYSCSTKEDCASLILEYLEALRLLLKKLEHFENNPSFLEPLHSLSRENMQTGSSSSRPPRKPSTKLSQTPQISVQPPPKETEKTNRKRCSTTFSKRHKCILKKAKELSERADTRLAVIMFSPSGNNVHSFGKPSVEEVCSQYFRCGSHVMPPTSRREWVEECDSCTTKEACAILIRKYLEALHRLREKLEDFENNPSVNASDGHDSGAGDGCGFGFLEDEDINSLEKNFETFHPSFLVFTEDGVGCHHLLTVLVDSAAGGGSSGADSNLTCSDREGGGSDLNGLLNLSQDNDFWSTLGNSPVGIVTRGEESSRFDLEG